MTLNKADVLFMYDHVDDAQRRMMVESLLDRIEKLESHPGIVAEEYIRELDVMNELKKIKEARDAGA